MMKEVLLTNWVKGFELEKIRLGPLTRLHLIKYAGASGDYNTIHTIDKDAEKAGLPGIIAHGMLTMAVVGQLFSPYLNIGCVEEFYSRFIDMVFLGDFIVVGGKLNRIIPVSCKIIYLFDVYANTNETKCVLKGRLIYSKY